LIILVGEVLMKFFLFLALIIAIVIIIFTFQNHSDVTLIFFGQEVSWPIPIILAIPFFVGTIAGMALIVPVWLKKARSVKAQKKQILELEEKLLNISEQLKAEETEEVLIEGESPQDTSSSKDEF
jgi:uncharacterized membrane protein YciS (DUF1049 family)